MICEGNDLAILSIGHVGNYVVEATEDLRKEGMQVGHYDMRFAKPLDEELLHTICKRYKYLITIEDGCLMGGFGSAVLEFMADHNYFLKVQRLGIPDRVVEHGEQIELHRECGFDPQAIYETALKMLQLELV